MGGMGAQGVYTPPSKKREMIREREKTEREREKERERERGWGQSNW